MCYVMIRSVLRNSLKCYVLIRSVLRNSPKCYVLIRSVFNNHDVIKIYLFSQAIDTVHYSQKNNSFTFHLLDILLSVKFKLGITFMQLSNFLIKFSSMFFLLIFYLNKFKKIYILPGRVNFEKFQNFHFQAISSSFLCIFIKNDN